jgi:hypothetical protein
MSALKWMLLAVLLMTNVRGRTQDIFSVIASGVTIAIKAVDLQIQRIQTRTIWLEEAQKVVENAMSAMELDNIRGWVQAQKDLYEDYFHELWTVKNVVAYYKRIETIISRQQQIISGYQRARALYRSGGFFSAEEISSIERIYGGMVEASLSNLDQLMIVIRSFDTQMSDEERMSMIDAAGDNMDRIYSNLVRFNDRTMLIYLQRSNVLGEVDLLKKIYKL